MKIETVIIRVNALENAAEMIKGHAETGLTSDDVGCDIYDYVKQCNYVAKFLDKEIKRLAKKYQLTNSRY